MGDRVFVDTSILVYAWDSTEPEKQKQALAWMTYLWKARTGRLSYQVLTEFYITVTQKLDPGMEPERARRNVRLQALWRAGPFRVWLCCCRSAPNAPMVMESGRQYVEAARVAVQLAAAVRTMGYPARAHIDGNYRVIAPLVARDAGQGKRG
jgi:predicted nucleic acid-binding protein